jgi:hypothetical protein
VRLPPQAQDGQGEHDQQHSGGDGVLLGAAAVGETSSGGGSAVIDEKLLLQASGCTAPGAQDPAGTC